MHWSGQTAAWKLDSVQVLPGTDNANITGNWSKDDEFIIKKRIDSSNPFRNPGSGKVGVVLKVGSVDELPAQTVYSGNRQFEGQTGYSDLSWYDGFISKSNDLNSCCSFGATFTNVISYPLLNYSII